MGVGSDTPELASPFCCPAAMTGRLWCGGCVCRTAPATFTSMASLLFTRIDEHVQQQTTAHVAVLPALGTVSYSSWWELKNRSDHQRKQHSISVELGQTKGQYRSMGLRGCAFFAAGQRRLARPSGAHITPRWVLTAALAGAGAAFSGQQGQASLKARMSLQQEASQAAAASGQHCACP